MLKKLFLSFITSLAFLCEMFWYLYIWHNFAEFWLYILLRSLEATVWAVMLKSVLHPVER